MDTFYITTPIYYPSDKLHIGHSYTTVAADVMARYKKARGFDVKFLTGTDEHGQKIERKAQEKGVSPKEYVDEIVVWIKDLWKTMDVDYDIFIRTTDKIHEDAVKKIFKKLYDKGEIYKGEYEGWYCTPCETFFTQRQLVDGKCPDCGRDVERIKEEAYFFKLSGYQDRILEHFEKNPDFLSPPSRRNEMISNFLKPGLEDLCVSRTSFTWGIPVDFDPGHVVYVWIDALSNYITALGFLSEDDSEYKKYWPADVHLVGKEIARFHTIIWPAMLMGLEEPLPKQVFAHGWLIIDGGKMSKSKGNVVDPKFLVDRYGVDALRYFLLREVAFGGDGNFSNEALLNRINADLANDLGNLVSRISGLKGPEQTEAPTAPAQEAELAELSLKVISRTEELMDKLLFSDALTEIWVFIKRLNKFAHESEPWKLAKANKGAEFAGVMRVLAEGLRISAVLVSPFMPGSSKAILDRLALPEESRTWESAKRFDIVKSGEVAKGSPIFPRIDVKAELAFLEGQAPKKEEPKQEEKKEEKKEEAPSEQVPGIIAFDDFAKLDLKVGLVTECEKVKGSDKLLKSQVKLGDETRQIVSGIAKWYTPEEMVGKLVVLVANLKPVKLKGQLSEGMLLAAEGKDGTISLVTVDKPVEDGSEVS